MRVLITLVALLLAGCTSTTDLATETIYLQNADGEVVQCGPYGGGEISGSERFRRVMQGASEGYRGRGREYLDSLKEPHLTRLRQCLFDYQMAGYGRIPAPPEPEPSS